MGCGQSKIHLYPRKSKSKANGKKSGHADTDADADDDEGHLNGDGCEKDLNRDKDQKIDNNDNNSDEKGSPGELNGEISISLIRAKNLSLLQSQEISSSQQNFFKMLDQKIDDGPDYDSNSETEIALEEARLNALVQHWESASLTASLCSSASRSLQTTPVRQVPISSIRPQAPLRAAINQLTTSQQPLSADLLPQHTTTPPGLIISHNQLMQQQQSMQLNSGIMPQQQQYMLSGGVMVPQNQLLANTLNLSPKRGDPRAAMTMVSQGGNIMQPYDQQQQQQYQQQMLMLSANNNINSSASSGVTRPPRGSQQVVGILGPSGIIPTHMQMATQYYGQPQSYFGEVLHPMQVPQAPPEYRFPPAISVQRLAPQVQRQLRETQELIKDSCPQLYAAGYGSPGPPIRNQQRNIRQRPPLETTYSTELS